MKTHYVECDCKSAEHVVRFIRDDESTYVEFQLVQYRPFWRRLWVAFRYLCGHKSKYGAWDTALLSDDELTRLRAFLAS